MSNLKKLTLFSMLMIGCFNVFAQDYTITGIVKDSTQTIAFANVILTDSNGEMSTGGITEEDGSFNLTAQQGTYIITVSFLGYQTWEQTVSANQNIDLGVIALKSQDNELDEVVVTAEKPLIERKVDRLIFNVQSSVYNSGTNVLDLLAKTPLVSANDQGVNMIGKGSVEIMVNDRIIQLSNQELASYLRTLSSDDVSEIEVITSPPSKYDAEGNSGLINIITKRNVKETFSGNLSTAFMKNTKESYYNNLALNYNDNNFSGSVKLRHSNRSMVVYENQDVSFSNGNALNNHTDRTDNSRVLGFNIDLSYKTSKRNNIGVVYDYGDTKSTYNNVNETSYFSSGTLDSLLVTTSSYKKPYNVHRLSIYDDFILDSIGSKLSLVFNYFDNKPETKLEFTTNDSNDNFSQTLNTSELSYNVLSGQMDFSLPTKWANYETGIKFTRFDNNSDIKYYEYINNQYELDSERNNQFGLIEDNYASYFSLNKKINDNWTIKAGLRYEYTDLKTTNPSENIGYETNYGKLFPTFNLMYKVENNTYTLNYNKRINRPRLGQLNPFRWYSNPYIYIVGNPFLLPSISHNLELNYLYKGMFMAGLFGSQQENEFGSLIKIEDEIKETKTENIYTIKTLGLNLSFEKKIVSKWWNLSVNAVGFHSLSESEYPEIEALEGWSANYSVNNTFTISQKKSWLFFLNFWHALPGTESNVESEGLTNLTIGTRFSLLEKKLTFNLRMNDLLKGSISKGRLIYDDFAQYYNNYYDNRNFTISVSYNFGSGKSSSRRIQFNEQYRAN